MPGRPFNGKKRSPGTRAAIDLNNYIGTEPGPVKDPPVSVMMNRAPELTSNSRA